MTTTGPIFHLDAAAIRERTSCKYQQYDADVLPLWVAEMDCALAPPIAERLAEAVRLGDTGYPMLDRQLPDALAGYAADRWSWQIDPARVRPVPDVGVGVTELLRNNLEPGDRVVVSSPVYPPFYIWTAKMRGELIDVPLLRGEEEWTLDLDGLRAAFADGAAAYLLCNPANPVGRGWRAAELSALAELAAEYGVLVVADEIHAPLALEGAQFVPFLTVSDTAREVGVSVLAASKGWNLAGLKCAQIVAGSQTAQARMRRIHEYTFESVGHFGMLATIVAWSAGREWRDQAVRELSANRELLSQLVAEHLPAARYLPPEATYLGWLDLTAYGWGDTPSRRILKEARVAVNPGPSFGATGRGCTRINFACSPQVLTEAMERIGALAAAG
ncbi:MalY/PatB family protein [Cumulibacter manganitolerans]|uniref:MalY/PatB family protein n=1 Tax=Cumulibacter manganitolerans TaxID=1884992 RepID=UPI001295AFC2|nr:aminotransferase class I/II-fold pyridoxal phosphate-dependent enzyme [Cumulibacter manganitolerans]